MRPEERDAGCLLDMLEHARGVTGVVAGKTLDDYLRDESLRLIVERRIPRFPGAASSPSGIF